MARKHDAQTTRQPQAFVPARVFPRTRCPECTFFFLGEPGTRCASCQTRSAPGISDTPVADAAAQVAQSVDTPLARQERWRQDVMQGLDQVETQLQGLLDTMHALRQRFWVGAIAHEEPS